MNLTQSFMLTSNLHLQAQLDRLAKTLHEFQIIVLLGGCLIYVSTYLTALSVSTQELHKPSALCMCLNLQNGLNYLFM